MHKISCTTTSTVDLEFRLTQCSIWCFFSVSLHRERVRKPERNERERQAGQFSQVFKFIAFVPWDSRAIYALLDEFSLHHVSAASSRAHGLFSSRQQQFSIRGPCLLLPCCSTSAIDSLGNGGGEPICLTRSHASKSLRTHWLGGEVTSIANGSSQTGRENTTNSSSLNVFRIASRTNSRCEIESKIWVVFRERIQSFRIFD